MTKFAKRFDITLVSISHDFSPRSPAGAIRNTGALILSAAAFALLQGAAAPAAAQNSKTFCTFPTAPNNCGFAEQAKVAGRATIANVGRDGSTAVRLTTRPGDNNVYGSGVNERNDVTLSQAETGCYAGQQQWWAHSILFPSDYVAPPTPTPGNWTWGAAAAFHHTTPGAGQPNFQVNAMSDGLSFQVYGGNPTSPVSARATIGPVTKNVWYDFVYNVRWSSGSDGFFQAWVNGVQKLSYSGPTLYTGQGCFLKLQNYHSPFGLATSIIHDRVVRGPTQADVVVGSTTSTTPTPTTSTGAARPADFNGDRKSDIHWNNNATGANQIWFMNGGTTSSTASIPTSSHPDWKVVGSRDFNADGKSDILWRNRVTGANALWFMNGATLLSRATVTSLADLNWKVAGTADFDGDGRADILWRNSATGANRIWLMNGATLKASAEIDPVADLNWKVGGVGDFDGNGRADILWRNASSGANTLWFMNGLTRSNRTVLTTMTDVNWLVAGIGDFNGDGKSDIVWRHRGSGSNYVSLMNGSSIAGGGYTSAMSDLRWQITGTGDFNGDGKWDVAWRHSATGQNAVFLMNGLAASVSNLSTLSDLNWSPSLK